MSVEGVIGMKEAKEYLLTPVGYIRSLLKKRKNAPRQGYLGAPDAWVEIAAEFKKCVEGIASGDEVVLITWLHEARRSVKKVHPGADENNPLMGVFATRSPDRPNPVGLHRVKVLEIEGLRLKVGPLEAIDGTPVVDIKPVLEKKCDS
jgi:tRNA-Thr(GGU) m(6)t(6)A37 methyltransferase TsaA